MRISSKYASCIDLRVRMCRETTPIPGGGVFTIFQKPSHVSKVHMCCPRRIAHVAGRSLNGAPHPSRRRLSAMDTFARTRQQRRFCFSLTTETRPLPIPGRIRGSRHSNPRPRRAPPASCSHRLCRARRSSSCTPTGFPRNLQNLWRTCWSGRGYCPRRLPLPGSETAKFAWEAKGTTGNPILYKGRNEPHLT